MQGLVDTLLHTQKKILVGVASEPISGRKSFPKTRALLLMPPAAYAVLTFAQTLHTARCLSTAF